jgi:hypothetical protein
MWVNITMSLAPFAQKLIHKEMYLSGQETAGLSQEHLALVDMMVMVQSKSFLGIDSSLHSIYVQEYRHAAKISRSTSKLVRDASGVVGNSDLAAVCGMFA